MLNAIKKKLISKKIRGVAENLKTNKEAIAQEIARNYKESGFGDSLAFASSGYSILIRVLNLIQTIYEAFNKSEVLRKMLLDLFYNIINDIALRINELANVIDKTLADDEVLDAFMLLEETKKRAEAVYDKISKSKAAREEEYEKAREKENEAHAKKVEDEPEVEQIIKDKEKSDKED